MPRDHLFAQVLQTGRRRNVDSWQRMEWIEHRRRHEGIKERHAKFDGNMLAMAANKATFSPMRTRAARSAGPRGIFPAPGGYVAGLHVRSLHCDDARLRAAGLRHSCSRRRGPMWYSIQPWQNARLRRGGWPAATGNRGAGGGSVVWGQTAGQRGVVVLGMLVGPANFVQAWTSNPPRGAPAAGRACLTSPTSNVLGCSFCFSHRLAQTMLCAHSHLRKLSHTRTDTTKPFGSILGGPPAMLGRHAARCRAGLAARVLTGHLRRAWFAVGRTSSPGSTLGSMDGRAAGHLFPLSAIPRTLTGGLGAEQQRPSRPCLRKRHAGRRLG